MDTYFLWQRKPQILLCKIKRKLDTLNDYNLQHQLL